MVVNMLTAVADTSVTTIISKLIEKVNTQIGHVGQSPSPIVKAQLYALTVHQAQSAFSTVLYALW